MSAAVTFGVNAAACDRLAYHGFALQASAQVAEPVASLGERDDRVSCVRTVGLLQGHLRECAFSPESLGTSRANYFQACACVAPDAVVRVAGIACFPPGVALGLGYTR